MHSITLNQYDPSPRRLVLGTKDSYGIEQIKIAAGDGWEGLTIKAAFHTPGGRSILTLPDDNGVITVPSEATAEHATQMRPGLIVLSGSADGVLRISTNVSYLVHDNAGVEGENPGTPTPTLLEQIIARIEGWYAGIQAAITTATDTAAEIIRRADDGEFDGKDAAINGVSTLRMTAGENITLTQDGSTLTISADGGRVSVSSVNGKTGTVVLSAADVGALPEGTPIPPDLSGDVSAIRQAMAGKQDKLLAGDNIVLRANGDGTVTISAKATRPKLYGFRINPNESNPASAVTYLEDAVGAAPAHMDYSSGVFDYGSWENAFFMPRPCMVRYDGTVDYYLDPNDYSKREDGTPSDVADISYGGNAMMEWGRDGKKIWTKVVPSADGCGADIYICDAQLDDSYHAYQFISPSSAGQNVVYCDHFYTPIYNGCLDSSNRLRSISGQSVARNMTATEELECARSNGVGWTTELFGDIQLIQFLLILIGKSLNTQEVFGYGRCGYAGQEAYMSNSGTMNEKGLFWGQNIRNGTETGVKVFGMEHFWGNQWRRYAGHISRNNIHNIKLCYGQSDGSIVDGYSLDGAGYLNTNVTMSGTFGGFISSMRYGDSGYMVPSVSSGSATTYYGDGLWFDTGTMYASRGGTCSGGLLAGAFILRIYLGSSAAGWLIGAAPSYKPLS